MFPPKHSPRVLTKYLYARHIENPHMMQITGAQWVIKLGAGEWGRSSPLPFLLARDAAPGRKWKPALTGSFPALPNPMHYRSALRMVQAAFGKSAKSCPMADFRAPNLNVPPHSI